MKKRVISAFLCTVMAVSLLTGCGSDEKKSADNKGSKDGNYEEFITVDVYDEFANYQGDVRRKLLRPTNCAAIQET